MTAALLAVLAAFAVPAAGRAMRCPGEPVATSGWSVPESERICAAAARALAFVRAAGQSPPASIEIRPLERRRRGDAAQPLGQYDAGSGVVMLARYEAAVAASRAHAPAFGLPMSAELWDSFVAHEIAHAVAGANFTAAPARRAAAGEYFAAIVQLSTMPQALRRSILERYDTAAFGDAGEVTMLLYEMDPAVFAVKSYRHYVALGGGGPAFLAMLMREGLAP
ncbi:MAG: hypothetical protein KF755_01865 [Burkholderiaceae bacterium]|nr:hypothetical protein [Burkholderiaceae bacterium]